MKTTPIGIAAGFALIFGAIFLGDGWATFFDPASLIMVLGGTASALMVAFSIDELKLGLGGAKQLFSFKPPDLEHYVTLFAELSRTARREGLLALDRQIQQCDDPFMRMGLEMAVDGIEEQEIDDLMRGRIATETARLALTPKFFNAAGTYAPSFGMVGTLIGLIQMMQNLTDPSAIGAGMAVAMITTFYGALLANLVFLPCANKAKAQMNDLLLARDLVRTGVLSIVRGESPSMVEKRLRLFLSEQTEAAPAENDSPLKKAA
ncbi:MotA/TolQ/ExbB proton channel family protein [Rhodocaloribacter litoris]|uniref:motility protein A n=1 Tax=Rhodocaloribacter litoris TaxID=2558931 RepID=UPI00141D9173|nr:MotA/TolQ/ExbB proton channel family protein [Rhodocaloribacter litoris]QXD16059.1 MotA/TolQ/ExbB proton channel family protein [Rhodocaloribacter litoris]